MTFWSNAGVEPARKYAFQVKFIDASEEDAVYEKLSFLAKSVNKPTVETEVNEYKLINQIKKFPSIPKWNDITIKLIDSVQHEISETLLKLMFGQDGKSPPVVESWNANAISKYKTSNGESNEITNNFVLVIDQLSAEGDVVSTWEFKNPFIKSINYGELDYSDDGFVEVEVVIAYDYAYLS